MSYLLNKISLTYFVYCIWARIWQKVPYGCVNQNLPNNAAANSISWKFEAVIFNIDEYMEVLSNMEHDVKKDVKPNMTSEWS